MVATVLSCNISPSDAETAHRVKKIVSGIHRTKPDSRERECVVLIWHRPVKESGGKKKQVVSVLQGLFTCKVPTFTLFGISIISTQLSLSVNKVVESFGTTIRSVGNSVSSASEISV